MDALAVSSLLNALALLRGPAVPAAPVAATAGASILDHLFPRSPPSAAMPSPPSAPGTGAPSPVPTPATARPGVLPLESLPPRALEAMVLSSSPLLAGPGGRPVAQVPPELLARLPGTALPAPSGAPPLFRTEVQVGAQRFDLLTRLPLPAQTAIRVEIAAAGLRLTALRPVAGSPAPAVEQLPADRRALELAGALQSGRRQTLPLQQPLHLPLTRLRERVADSGAPLPRAIAASAQRLLDALPQPAQLSETAGLRAALASSGAATEARLAQLLGSLLRQRPPGSAAAPPPAVNTDSAEVQAVLADDRRAQLGALLALLRAAPARPSQQATATPAAAPTGTRPEELTGTKPLSLGEVTAGGDERSESADLAGLQRLVQSAVARIQHHQLEGALSRQPAPDGAWQPPVWLFELPIQTPRGIDQLQLRFEQQGEAGSAAATRRSWQVRLDFDLHDLGRFTAMLQANASGVAATLWSEYEQTHRLVRDSVAALREKLAGAGVAVSDVVCRQGLPGEPAPLAASQLIDVRT